jgi:hypothetical protein
MEDPRQLTFKVIMDTSKNWFACPKQIGIENEIKYNLYQLETVSRKSIFDSVKLCERIVQLDKERQRS